jgi:molybdopterin-guanine dinucleotide biosynthesis protein A
MIMSSLRRWQSRHDHGEEVGVGDEATWDAVVLAGGEARRLGGIDKAALMVGNHSLLDVALTACAGARSRVVVGPVRRTTERVQWTREEPAGSGPLAALGAGLATLPGRSDVVVVLAADLPSVDGAVVGRLRAVLQARSDVAGAVVVDAKGQPQPLLAAYRRPSLERAIAAVGDLRDQPVREILRQLTVAEILDATAANDIDTPADLARWTRDRPRRP